MSWSTSKACKKQSHIIGSLNSDGQQFHKYQQNEGKVLNFESHKTVVSSNLSVGQQPNQLNGNSNGNTYINKQLIIYICVICLLTCVCRLWSKHNLKDHYLMVNKIILMVGYICSHYISYKSNNQRLLDLYFEN
jgi:hypothetical protein